MNRLGAATLGIGVLVGCRAGAEFDAEKYLVYGFGELSLRPRLEVSETYDSNLFYAETDLTSDLITRIRPGFALFYGRSADESVTSLSYNADVVIYAEQGDLDYVGHAVSHNSRFRFARTTISGRDSLTTSRTTLGGTFAYLRAPVSLMSLRDEWRVDYELSPKTVVGADFEFDWTDYAASDLTSIHLYDFTRLGGSIRAGYTPSDRIVVYPQLTYSENYLSPNQGGIPDAADLTAYGVNIGAEGEFTPKLIGSISGGYEIREYSDGTDVPDGWISRVSLTWRPRAKTTVTVAYRHWIQVARDARGTAYTSDRPSINVTQELGVQGRWTVGLDGYLELHEYADGFPSGAGRIERSDDMAGVGLRSTYRWAPWLNLIAAYDFSSYSDNVKSIPNYEVHRVSVRLVAGY